jgi:hypothetical protein
MQRQTLITIVSLLLLLGLAFGLVDRSANQKLTPVVQASGNENSNHGQSNGRRCRLRNLEGGYGILATGTIVTPPPGVTAGPFATAGKMDVEEDGNATVVLTRSFNGTITHETLPGNLTINDDCTGTATFGGVRTFDIVSVDGGNELQFIQTNPGTVVTVIAKRR